MTAPIEESVNRIKQTVNWFPGLLLGLERQCGKSRAILELVREKHSGDAFIFSPNQMLSRLMSNRYRDLYPKTVQPPCISDTKFVRGSMWPIYVDEWWMLQRRMQEELMETGRVVCRLGTEK
jgi:hypothetical protein